MYLNLSRCHQRVMLGFECIMRTTFYPSHRYVGNRLHCLPVDDRLMLQLHAYGFAIVDTWSISRNIILDSVKPILGSVIPQFVAQNHINSLTGVSHSLEVAQTNNEQPARPERRIYDQSKYHKHTGHALSCYAGLMGPCFSLYSCAYYVAQPRSTDSARCRPSPRHRPSCENVRPAVREQCLESA